MGAEFVIWSLVLTAMAEQIKNLKEAAERIVLAGKRKERVIVYGDADLDGVAALIIMRETVKNLGGNVVANYFPDREVEGYGITPTALNLLKKFAPALLVAVDLGIGNFDELKQGAGFRHDGHRPSRDIGRRAPSRYRC